MIASKYTRIQEMIYYNGVTLSSNEVAITARENIEWKLIFQKTEVNFIIIEHSNFHGVSITFHTK